MQIGGMLNKRCWQVKITGQPSFSMIIMDDDVDPHNICKSIFGERLEWVK